MLVKNTLLICIAALLLGCNACHNTTPIFPKDDTNENERNNRLFVFVGKKIAIQNEPYVRGSLDNGFTAKYKVLQRVYGNYEKDTIEFTAYDHYGIPAFSKYKNVLLFVSEYEGKYYHEKYQYTDVYKTKNGRWAGSYSSLDYSHDYNKHTTIKPEKIDFIEEVSYPTKIKYTKGTEEEHNYPEPYFKIVGDKAVAVYGNYIEELFQLKKEGVLTDRGLFGNKQLGRAVEVQDVELEEVTDSTWFVEESKFITFWKTYYKIIKVRDVQRLQKQALDSLWVCDSLIPAHRFSKKCFSEVLDMKSISKLGDSSEIEYSWRSMDTTKLFSSAKKKILKARDTYRLRSVKVSIDIVDYRPVYFYISFMNTKKGFKLFGLGYDRHKKCCW